MKEPTAARGNSTPAPREAAAPVRRVVETAELRVVTRYYRRMKPQRVYDLVVELQGAGISAASPVFVNPVIPGALVTPAELTLDPMVAGSTATFHVTPLAKGTLRGARLDVFHQGKLVQEIRLAMRSVTQRLTWVLAVLTLLVPAFLLYFTVYHPMTGIVPVVIKVDRAKGGLPEPEKLKNLPREQTQPLEGEDEEEELQDDAQLAQRSKDQPSAKEEPQPKEKQSGRGRGAAGPPGEADPQSPLEKVIFRKASPGEALEMAIQLHVPDVPSHAKMPWQGEADEPYEMPFAVTKHVASGLGEVYTYACDMRTDHVSFWVGVGFLALTVVSAVTHRASSKRQRGKPLALAGGGLAMHSAGAR